MSPRVLAVLIPIASIVAACSSSAAAPTWTYAPSAAAAASPSHIAVASPSAALPASPTPALTETPPVAPSAQALTADVPVTMTDAMRFAPGAMTVKAGEPITFVVKNAGVIVHEFFVGTEAEQVEHAAEMAAGGMSHGQDNAVSVQPGKIASLTMTFAEGGSLVVGCHEPGHYDAGMKATLTVAG